MSTYWMRHSRRVRLESSRLDLGLLTGKRTTDLLLDRLALNVRWPVMDVRSGICAIETHAIVSSQACEDLRLLRRRCPGMAHMIEEHKTVLDTLNGAQSTFRSPSLDRREQEGGPCSESGLQGGRCIVTEIMKAMPSFQQRDDTCGCPIALLR